MLVSSRRAKLERITKETAVTVQVNIDGTGKTNVKTGLSFIDHLVTSIGKHAMIDITVNGKSNDGIVHHLAEDVAIALAQTIDKALGDRTRIARFGYALIPMDEADWIQFGAELGVDEIQLSSALHPAESDVPPEAMLDPVANTLDLRQPFNSARARRVEAALKAFAVALRMATSMDRQRKGVPSTKGAM